MLAKDKVKILVAASGTGGHLFPALSFAQTLEKDLANQRKSVEIIFVGSGRPLENELVGKAGYKLLQYKISGVSKLGIKGIINFLTLLPSAVRSVKTILQVESPSLVIGFGGYASVLPVLLAKLSGIPTIIFEVEKKAGLANSFLSLFAKKTATTYEKVRRIFSSNIVVGKILRPAMLNFSRQYGHKVQKILVMGGSQGCRSIDLAMVNFARQLAEKKQIIELEIWHQARPENVSELNAAYDQAKIKAEVCTFLNEPEKAYHWADFIISRAGAGAMQEIAISGVPALLVPLPNAEEQLNNAKLLAATGRALYLEESTSFSTEVYKIIQAVLQENFYQQMLSAQKLELEVNGAENLVKLARSILDL